MSPEAKLPKDELTFFLEGEDSKKWVDLCVAVAAKGDPLIPYLDLRTRYSEPLRKYHVWKHIAEGLTELDVVENLAVNPNEIRLAYYFHDAIYDTTVKDSENVDNSARLAANVLQKAQLSVSMVSRVSELVLVTKHTVPVVGIDAQIMIDIDLSILGKTDNEFDEYERNVRQEYQHVDERTFRRVRVGILEGILQRPQIYHIDHFLHKYEAQARRNLQRSISQLHY